VIIDVLGTLYQEIYSWIWCGMSVIDIKVLVFFDDVSI